ncbi:MAG: hypothetical protein IOC54_08990 [Methylobacterium sp.]|nr:hypothetical protein [Methylobacterium sp.]MCA3651958.1 hypothetical protein [Methylobacterium sp.]MCA4922819.1 hypothetical protein [Methylobacterium sp.]
MLVPRSNRFSSVSSGLPSWRLLARAAKALNPRDWRERYEMQERALAAAYLAYERSRTKSEDAASLHLLGQVFEWREMWRPALTAYRLSHEAEPRDEMRQAYETLRESRGFRLTGNEVDADSANPRACFTFSEPLARGRVDFAPFVAITGGGDFAVEAEDSRICVEGLRHGERYGIVLRAGIPSTIPGENLLKNADYDIYVRDRKPSARGSGRAYVLPKTGQQGIPVISVNTTQLGVKILRIGDRNLVSAVREGGFLDAIEPYRMREIIEKTGQQVWSGTMGVTSELNKDVTTAFPVQEAVGELKPGIAQGASVSGLPLTVVIKRPDGMEFRRVLMEDQGAGGRALSVPLLSNAAIGTWRAQVFSDPKRPAIGVRPLFSPEEMQAGGTAKFGVILATGQGKRLARSGLKWQLSRLTKTYQWFFKEGRWTYEAITTTRRVADGDLATSETAMAEISAQIGWGNHRIEVRSLGSQNAETAFDFTIGHVAEARADTPDVLDVVLDRAAYADGDTMNIRLTPRAAGKAIIAVIADRVAHLETVDLPAEGANIRLKVSAEWGPGAYLVALAHRPLDARQKRMPGRALGLSWFSIGADQRKLALDLGAPQLIRPRGTLTLPIRVGNIPAGEEAFVTVAAVDNGILNLTRYQPPNAAAHFFGQRQLAGEIRDLYGALIADLRPQPITSTA